MLDMLAVWPEGVLEPVLRAHGFQPKLIVALIGAGLASGHLECAISQGTPISRDAHEDHSGRALGAGFLPIPPLRDQPTALTVRMLPH